MSSTSGQVLIGFVNDFFSQLHGGISFIITLSHILCEGFGEEGEKLMNKTLIVLGAGIWAVLILLRFVPLGDESSTLLLLNILELVAFAITIVGIVKRN
jgi:hypothetical protein